MKPCQSLFAALMVFLPVWLLPSSVTVVDSPPAIAHNPPFLLPHQEETSGDPFVWTQWDGNQYALAEEGSAIWVGTAMGALRWDKASGAVQRYSSFEGLPSTQIFAVAVDLAGNRWFGGDGGLSRLDAGDRWTHYTAANSGLASDLVDGIAVAPEGTLWVSHGLPDGPVSRRDPDGMWRWYPNREAAVSLDYAIALHTINPNPLWTVAGSEVWVGYSVFNGAVWQSRPPTTFNPDPFTVAGQNAVVYTTNLGSIYSWNGDHWNEIGPFSSPHEIYFQRDVLSVDSQSRLWLAGVGILPGPAVERHYFLARLEGNTLVQMVELPDAAQALLSSASGPWTAGDSWLLDPGQSDVMVYSDLPARPAIADIVTGPDDGVWLVSELVDYCNHAYCHCDSTLQILDDGGSGRLDDDRWRTVEMPAWVVGSEPAPGGDVLYVLKYNDYSSPSSLCSLPVVERWRDGDLLAQYYPPYLPQLEIDAILDVFAENAQKFWFVYHTKSGITGVAGVDDRGTPGNPNDDRWTDYPVLRPNVPQTASIAIDNIGRVWYADDSGLYRRSGNHWQTIDTSVATCDLTPGTHSTMIVQGLWNAAGSGSCEAEVVTFVDANDQVAPWEAISDFIENRFDLVLTARHRNLLWRVADDRSVWYVDSDGRRVNRRSGDELASYWSPDARTVRLFEVEGGRVWLVLSEIQAGTVATHFARLSPQPDFTLTAIPRQWLLTPGSEIRLPAELGVVDGYNHPVALTMTGLPSQINVAFDPNPVQPGTTLSVAISAAAGAAPGSYTGMLSASSDLISHTMPITVTIVSQVQNRWLPLVQE